MDYAATWCPRRQEVHQPAGRNMLIGYHAWQLDHANALYGSMEQLRHIIGHEAWPVCNADRSAIPTVEFPCVFRQRRAKVQARQAAEIHRHER